MTSWFSNMVSKYMITTNTAHGLWVVGHGLRVVGCGLRVMGGRRGNTSIPW